MVRGFDSAQRLLPLGDEIQSRCLREFLADFSRLQTRPSSLFKVYETFTTSLRFSFLSFSIYLNPPPPPSGGWKMRMNERSLATGFGLKESDQLERNRVEIRSHRA